MSYEALDLFQEARRPHSTIPFHNPSSSFLRFLSMKPGLPVGQRVDLPLLAKLLEGSIDLHLPCYNLHSDMLPTSFLCPIGTSMPTLRALSRAVA